jgi:hypothetical protein
MQLDHHVSAVHDQLIAAAALGDERTREIAGTLAGTATSAVRLALIGAVSQAADETTAALLDYPGAPAIAARLDGDEITLEVRATATTADADGGEQRREDGEPSARISLRLSEALKADIDAAAERDGVSVNTWLVRAATAALEPQPFGPRQFGGSGAGAGAGGWRFDPFQAGADFGGKRRNPHHITGWIDG